MAIFEIGMIVRSKHGGPKMTIVDLAGRDDAGLATVARCVWVDESKNRREDVFDLRCLEEVTPPRQG